MVIKRLSLTVAFLLVLLSLAGCGIPKADYEAVVAEKVSAQSEVESLKNQLSTAQSASEALTLKIARAKALSETLSILVPSMKGQDVDEVDLLFQIRDKVKATGDTTLQTLFDQLMTYSTTNDQAVSLKAVEFVIYVIETLPKTLE